MLWYIYCKIKEQWPPVFMFTHPCIHSCARYWSDLILSTPCHPRASCYRNIHVGRRDRGQGSEHSTTLLLGFYPSHICSSFVLLFPSLPVLCQFMMAFVVWDWDSMSHYRISNAYDFPGKLKMCHSLPCVTDSALLMSVIVDASSWWQSPWTPLRNVQSDIHQPWSNVQCHYRDNRWFSQASIFLLL